MNRNTRFFFWLFIVILSFAPRAWSDQKLPLTERTVNLDFAIELSKLGFSDAIAKVEKKGVRVLYWNPKTDVIERHDLPENEKNFLLTYLKKANKFHAITLAKDFQSKNIDREYRVEQSTIVFNTDFLASVKSGRAASLGLAHEWLHLELMKDPSPLLGKGRIVSLIETSRVLSDLKKTFLAQGVDLKWQDLTDDYVTKNAERYETFIKIQYVQLLGQLGSLSDEWDIHLQMCLSGLTEDRPKELATIAQHLENRIKLAHEYSDFYRMLEKHKKVLTKDTVAYGEGTEKIETYLEGLVEKYFDQLKAVATEAELQEVGTYRAPRELSQKLK